MLTNDLKAKWFWARRWGSRWQDLKFPHILNVIKVDLIVVHHWRRLLALGALLCQILDQHHRGGKSVAAGRARGFERDTGGTGP